MLSKCNTLLLFCLQTFDFRHGTIYPGAPEMYLGLALGPDPMKSKLANSNSVKFRDATGFCNQGVTWISARAANTAIVKWC